MACPICKRAQAGSCSEGYIKYLSGDFPCPFNPDKDWLGVRNPKVLPPLKKTVARVRPPEEPDAA